MHDNENDPASLDIQTPCDKAWNELHGRGAKRFCESCELFVVDLSSMTKEEGIEWYEAARAKGERACAMLTRSADGSYRTRDARRSPAPVRSAPDAGVLALGRAAATFLMGVFAAFVATGCHEEQEGLGELGVSAGASGRDAGTGNDPKCGTDLGQPGELQVLGGIEMGRVAPATMGIMGEVVLGGGGEALIGDGDGSPGALDPKTDAAPLHGVDAQGEGESGSN